MRVVVTGGAGFIGGHLAAAFLRGGHDVTVFDNLEPFYDRRLKERTLAVHREVADESDGSYAFRDGDVRDAEAVREADAEHTHASIEKAAERIGYDPSRSIEAGVSEFIDWYEANREWYEPLVRSS